MAPAPERLVLGRALGDWKHVLASVGSGFAGGLVGMLLGPVAIATGVGTSIAGKYVGQTDIWKTFLYSMGASQIGAGFGSLTAVADAGVGVSSSSDVSSVGGVAWLSYIRLASIDLLKDALGSLDTSTSWTTSSTSTTSTASTTGTPTVTW